MTDLTKPVVRRTQFEVTGRRIVASMHSNGVTLYLERSREKKTIPWAKLYATAFNLPGPVKE